MASILRFNFTNPLTKAINFYSCVSRFPTEQQVPSHSRPTISRKTKEIKTHRATRLTPSRKSVSMSGPTIPCA